MPTDLEVSPFPYQGPLEPGQGGGRELLVDDLVQRIRARRVTALLGPRRYGKTSLLRELAAASPDLSTVWVDCYEVTSIADAAIRLDSALSAAKRPFATHASQLAAAVSLNLGVVKVELARPPRHRPDPTGSFSLMLDVLVGSALRTPSLLVLDEFASITGVEGVAGGLRTALQHHYRELGIVFAGSHPSMMRALFSDRAQPFFGQADLVEVPPLAIDDVVRVVAEGFRARAERNRLRARVGAAMRAMAKKGERFLGGRPPYGYRLAPTSTIHPNPEKARHGIHLTMLEIDPDRADIVRQIFAWRLEGIGYRTIAMRLDDAGFPSPSAADRLRNPHRAGDGWAVSAVRAIVMNPRYKGTERFGAYKKVERLFDPGDPAAGHVTRMVRADPDNVITIPGGVPAIVDEVTWQRAQPSAAPVGRGPRPDRPSAGRYALRGLLVCDACGRTMQGHMVRRRSGAQRLGYRCAVRAEYPGRKDHSSSLFVAEARLLPAIDNWLGQLTDPERIDETVQAIVAADSNRASEPPEIRRARRSLADARDRLDHLMAGLEAGLDPKLAVGRIRHAQTEVAVAEAIIARHDRDNPDPLTEETVRSFLRELGGLQGLLAEAEPGERRRTYEAAGVALRYRREDDGREALVAGLRVGFSRVGGGT